MGSKLNLVDAGDSPFNQTAGFEHSPSSSPGNVISGTSGADVGPNGADQKGRRSWTSYFDYIVVDANKPKFFTEGNTLREVDTVC